MEIVSSSGTGMRCPYCRHEFDKLIANRPAPEDNRVVIMPILCQFCGKISLLEDAIPRRITKLEMKELKRKSVWVKIRRAQVDINRARMMDANSRANRQ